MFGLMIPRKRFYVTDAFDSMLRDLIAFPLGKNLFDELRTHTNLKEKDDKYILTFDLENANKEDINLSIIDDGLIEVKAKNEDCRYNYVRSIPTNVNFDGIKAKFKDGVLKVLFPKEQPRERKQVEIE